MREDQLSGPLESLSDGEIHVWNANLTQLETSLRERSNLLSPDERSRAEGFHRQAPRQEFCQARVLLRVLLEHYGAGRAADISFSYSSTGKPAVEGGGIHFSVSHSERVAMFAFSAAGPVGIDVEKVRPVGEMDGIVERYFSEKDRAVYQSASERDRPPIFFRVWTRREAILKAIGIGIPGLEESVDETVWKTCDLLSQKSFFAALAYERRREAEVVSRRLNPGSV